jgi:hypothetical protein
MDVWLRTEGAAKGESFRFRLVRSPQQATSMTQNNAREAMHGAKHDYPEYTWEMESGFKAGEFVVHLRAALHEHAERLRQRLQFPIPPDRRRA